MRNLICANGKGNRIAENNLFPSGKGNRIEEFEGVVVLILSVVV
jgi:hypothetical protein